MAFNPTVRDATVTHNEDRRWIKTLMGYDQCRSVTLDVSTFLAQHIAAKGGLPSGLVLARITATGKYGPYTTGGAGGLEVAAGFLFNSVMFVGGSGVNLATHPDVAATLYWGPGIIDQDKLPTFAGVAGGAGLLDAAARADLGMHIRFEGTDL